MTEWIEFCSFFKYDQIVKEMQSRERVCQVPGIRKDKGKLKI